MVDLMQFILILLLTAYCVILELRLNHSDNEIKRLDDDLEVLFRVEDDVFVIELEDKE